MSDKALQQHSLHEILASFSKPDYPFDLGNYSPSWSKTGRASDPCLSAWLTRGLLWSYSFNHEASAACYQNALELSHCNAMAHWGYAYACGPNYNKPWEVFDKLDLMLTLERCHRYACDAYALAQNDSHKYSVLERSLCEALTYRYPPNGNVLHHSAWNRAYAHAMKNVYKLFPHDLDVVTLYADALMNLSPWALWDIHSRKPRSGAPTLEVKDVLENALHSLQGAREHPGILHLYTHLMEMSPTLEVLIPIADQLRDLCPDAAHLQHMPSHVDVLCGEWRQAVIASRKALSADTKYFTYSRNPFSFQTFYRCHNYHFGIYAAMMSGQSRTAFDMVDGLEAAVPESLLRVKSPPMADWLEGFCSIRVHVLIRFGRWHDLIGLSLPTDQDLYSMTTAMICYGKGIAYAVLEDLSSAYHWLDRFRNCTSLVPRSRRLFSNSARSILAIADEMLRGELYYREALLKEKNIDVFDSDQMSLVQQTFETAFAHLKQAIHHDDHLPYHEPWSWMMPTRHAYGALSLEQGCVEQAAHAYAQDLGFTTDFDALPRQLQHPNNVWALHGYHECLKRLGRDNEAAIIQVQLRFALAVADIDIKSSCFCRQSSRRSPSRTQV